MILTVMFGIPGSGKSTWAAGQGLPVLTADPLRLDSGINTRQFLEAMEVAAARLLSTACDVIIDVCAVQQRERERWLDVAARTGAGTRLVVMSTNDQEAMYRNFLRKRPVPAKVMVRYARDKATALQTIRVEPWDAVVDDRNQPLW